MPTVFRVWQQETANDGEESADATLVFRVEDTAAFSAVTAKNSVSLNIGSLHPDDSTLICTGKRAQSSNWDNIWFVVLTYSDQTSEEDSEESQQDPEDRAPVWDYKGIRFSEFAVADVNDEPFLNAAGDPFEPQEIPFGGVQVTMQVWRLYDDFDPRIDYFDVLYCVNDAPWGEYNDFDIGEALMVDLLAPTELVNGRRYRRLTYVAQVKFGGWELSLLNKGFNDMAFGVKGPCQDHFGRSFKEPQLLDEDGFQLDLNQDGEPDGDPVYLPFDIYFFATFPTS